MKSLSVKVNRSFSGGKFSKRKKGNKTKTLSVTSLIDILTILLVFMLKNISMDAMERDAPKGMELPSTITKDELLKTGQAIILRVYPDQMYYGRDSTPVGSLQEFISNEEIRNALLENLKIEAEKIRERNSVPVLLIQADKELYCQYITQLVKFSANSTIANIYFSSIKVESLAEAIGS